MPAPTPLLPVDAIRADGDLERFAQGRRNAVALGALAVEHFALAWAYGDVVQQVLFGGGVTAALCVTWVLRRLPDRFAYRLGLATAPPTMILVLAVLPPDLRGPALLAPFGLAMFSGALTSREALLSFLTAWVGGLAVDFLGWGPGYESSVPELTSILVTLGSTFAVATHEMVASHRRADRARALIGAHRASLAVEDARLAADRAELEGATSTLERETEALERLRAREGRLSDELAAKRADERALINAIHQDLREPLRSVVSFGQLIARRIDEAEGGAGVREYVGYAVDGGRRMAVMLDDLLRYAEAAETDGAEAVDLAEVVGGARRDLHAVVERTGARVDVDAAALPTVYGHPTQLTQLFLNLLNNALKFARPGRAPVVTVTAYPTGESGATVEVRDAGIGIPAAQLDKVFGLFNRAHDGDGYEGSGVGLALCRRIAIAHGAELAVASVEGEGTTFSIAFAQVARPRAGAAPGPSSPAALVAC